MGLPVVARPCMAGASDGHGEGLEVKVTIFTGRMRRSWVDAGVGCGLVVWVSMLDGNL